MSRDSRDDVSSPCPTAPRNGLFRFPPPRLPLVMDPGDDPAVVKDDLRDFLLSRRRARPPAESAAAADAIVSTLLEGLKGVGTLAAFVPDPAEPGSGRLPDAYTELGARVLLPVIPTQGRILDWAVYTGELEDGRFGLSHP